MFYLISNIFTNINKLMSFKTAITRKFVINYLIALRKDLLLIR